MSELVLAAVEMMGRAGRLGSVRVQGESMCPTLRTGQLLEIDFSPDRLTRGDMLVFRQGDLLLVHRLLGAARPSKGQPRLRTRGDGVSNLDPPVDLDRVVGRVVAIEDGERRRSTRNRSARAYAWCLAWHDLFWAVVAVASRPIDRALQGMKIPWRIGPLVASLDRRLLRLAHRALFDRLHSAVPRAEGPTE